MTGRRNRRTAGLLGVAVLLAGGCGVRPTGVIGAGGAPTATATSLPETKVYFLLHGRLHPVVRAVPPWNTQAVFDALLAGPTADERARGLRTALDGTDVTIRDLRGKGLIVSGGGRPVASLAYAQVLCTIALLPNRPLTPIITPPVPSFVAIKTALAAGCPDTPALDRLIQDETEVAPPDSGPTAVSSARPAPARATGGAGPQGAAR